MISPELAQYQRYFYAIATTMLAAPTTILVAEHNQRMMKICLGLLRRVIATTTDAEMLATCDVHLHRLKRIHFQVIEHKTALIRQATMRN